MNCNGKCYLAKKLQQQEKQEQEAPNSSKDKFEYQTFFLPKQFSFAGLIISTEIEHFHCNNFYTSLFHRAIFHPPAV